MPVCSPTGIIGHTHARTDTRMRRKWMEERLRRGPVGYGREKIRLMWSKTFYTYMKTFYDEPHCISYFSHCWDKMLHKSSLRKEGFIWIHNPGWESFSGASARHLLPWRPQSGSRDKCYCSAHNPLTLRLRDGTTHESSHLSFPHLEASS